MDDAIRRDIGGAAAREHDLIVIGGGVYGACMALVAAQRGLRPLLVERDDFGGATSRSSLRIVHGGLRYLQSLDVARCRQSARERAWMLREFPDLVRPLACLLPLDGRRLRTRWAFRAALAMERAIGRAGLGEAYQRVPRGGTVSADQVATLFPHVDQRGLRGGGVWYDGLMVCPERLLIEMLRWACGLGATALNYVEATGLLRGGGKVAGIEAIDAVSGCGLELRAPIVVNCAGPWCREVASRMHQDVEQLFRPSLAFNVLLDLPPPSPMAVAVRGPRAGAPMYFLVPCHGRVMAGTVHAACGAARARLGPTREQIRAFLREVRDAAPGWEPADRHVVSVLAGLLPAEAAASARQSRRPVVIDHSQGSGGERGIAGLWSVSGVKYTTARLVAEQTLDRVVGTRGQPAVEPRPSSERWPALLEPDGLAACGLDGTVQALRRVVDEEAVVRVSDLVMRRSAWGLDPGAVEPICARVSELLGMEAGPGRGRVRAGGDRVKGGVEL